MECYPKPNTSPFVHSIDHPSVKTTTCCNDTKLGGHCYWDEALFDCLQDFGSNDNSSSDFRVNTGNSLVASQVSSSASPTEAHADDYDAQDDGEGYGGHAALHYEDVEEAGPPARPQEFPTPFLYEATRTTIQAMDHRTQNVRVVKNVLMALNSSGRHAVADCSSLDRAYLLKKRISKSTHGNCYLSVVLQRRATSKSRSFDRENVDEKQPEEEDDWTDVEWESTEEFVTVTVSPWSEAMRQHRRSLSLKREGSVHAIAAMQHVRNYHPNVMGLSAVFCDEHHLYMVTPFHGGIDLQTKILANREQGPYKPNEVEARVIFTQLLQGLFHLQRKGVCHSNISLENIYIDRNNQNLVIADLGRSIRVPYNDPSNFGCLTGETEGTTRRLLQLFPQDFETHPPENLMYLAPEIVENEPAFDGFAADLWAAACILFVMLVGMAPFKTAHYWDAAYAEIASGNLKGLLASLNIHLSEEATALLQDMFWRDPRERLTLAQVLDHPWVKNQRFPVRSSTSTTSSSLPRIVSSSPPSNDDTASTNSSYGSDKPRLSGVSSHSRKSLSKTITGLFGGGSKEMRDGSNKSGVWGGIMSSSNSSRGRVRRKMSFGGLSSGGLSVSGMSMAASSATTGSPSSLKSVTAAAEEEKQDAFGFQVLSLPNL